MDWLLNINTFFEGDDGDGGAGDGGAGAGAGSGDGKISFDDKQQEHINSLLAAEKRKYQTQINDLSGKLNKANLTEQQKQALETELDNVRATLRTKEEQAQHELEKAAEKHQSEVKVLTEDRDNWKGLYTKSTIDRSLMDAGLANEAVNPDQIRAILAPNTTIIEEKDETSGKKTGRLVPQVTISLPDKEGNMQELKLSPNDAVKRMSEAPKLYGNLFKSGAVGGAGTNPNNPDGEQIDIQKIAREDPALYRKLRKEGKTGTK